MSKPSTDYTLEKMPTPLSSVLTEEIIQFWASEGALQGEAARQRVGEVYLAARHKHTGAIVGVCTIKPLFIESMGLSFYAFRCFVAQSHRSFEVLRQLFLATYDDLNGAYTPHAKRSQPSQPVGLFADIENTLLQQRKGAVWADARNLTFIGLKPNGNHIRIAYFEGAQI